MKLVILMSLLIGLFPGLNSWAADISANEWDKRITLRGGAIAYDMSGKFSSTKEGRPNVKLDLDDLDLEDDEVTYFLGANIRMGERWRLHTDYFRYSDDATQTANKDFEFDDLIVNVGARVESSLSFDLYIVNLSYDLYKSERANFGVGIGAHIVDFSLDVSSTITVDDGSTGFLREEENLTAPLPNLFAGGAYAFKNNLIFRYTGGWMSMSYGDYDGDLVYAQGVLEYWPHKNIGLGAGYAYRSVDVTYKTNSKKETYDIDIPGPILYLTVGF
ncbi:MAG: hypothetical protein QNK24_02565 [Desulfuromusa sp.]|nr:hypothetical protein [Desulfuromusa sp.]